MSPSGINSSKTIFHDEIHLWLTEDKNTNAVIAAVHGIDKGIEIMQKQIELPLYSGRTYLIGTTDALIDYNLGGKTYALIVEIKPQLYSASGIIGQVKSYRDVIEPSYTFKGKQVAEIQMCILTYDTNSQKYDILYESEGIHIYRVPKPEPPKNPLTSKT